jgi:hypothetical protein
MEGVDDYWRKRCNTVGSHQSDAVGAASIRLTRGHGGIGDFGQRNTSEGANHDKDHETN